MTNCVYIFGNGFDIRMGMPTGYPDFLKYYRTSDTAEKVVSSKKEFLSKIDENIKEGKTEWKDLEFALGLFTKGCSDIELFKTLYRDLNHSLIEYLSHQSPLITDEDKTKFWNDLMYPENYLSSDHLKKSFWENSSRGETNADIISFNYTKTIEFLLDDRWDKDLYYSEPSTADLYRVKSINHIHGVLDDNGILFGVNDSDQIANEQFRKDESLLDLIVKPKGNSELGTNIDQECLSLIQNAKVFYIYGTSLGPTDQYWWDCIGNRFRSTSDSVILYFSHTSQKLEPDRLPIEYISSEREIRKKIMSIMRIPGSEKDYRNRIYAACNTNVFPTHLE
ncbi:AbiH family protein [Segatella buccae]|uniref:AbiH family protein n=1 Tax=Segatella buccae TaxID=28126 RepID=UPI0027B8BC72|nr:AbiH family protein [Segatella buccae]